MDHITDAFEQHHIRYIQPHLKSNSQQRVHWHMVIKDTTDESTLAFDNTAMTPAKLMKVIMTTGFARLANQPNYIL